MINPHFPSLAFVAGFLAAFGRLDPFNPSLMYLWCVKGDQIPSTTLAKNGISNRIYGKDGVGDFRPQIPLTLPARFDRQ
jgi:hypothetical protein